MSRPVLIFPNALFAAPVAALLVAMPVAVRLGDDRLGQGEVWIGAAGLLCPILAIGIVAARAARRTAASIGLASAGPWLPAAALWALLAVPATAFIGTTLKANTHHRALGGATFAVMALFLHAGAMLAAWRMPAIVLPRIRHVPARVAVTWLLTSTGLIVLAVALVGAARPGPEMGDLSLRGLLADGVVALFAVALATVLDPPIPDSRRILWFAGGAAFLLTALGLIVTARSPLLARTLGDRAPLAGAVSQVLGLSGDSASARNPQDRGKL